MTHPDLDHEQLQHERWSLLAQIDALTETPLIALSLVWLGLLILDLTQGLSPFLQTLSLIIWALFVLDFAIELLIAPHKRAYLRRNWLTAISLLLPALRLLRLFRVFRLLRAARATRSISLVRVVTSLNRGMGAVGRTLGRRGVGYVVAVTVLVTFGGAAGMYAFEGSRAQAMADDAGAAGMGLDSYGEAVWWTAMLMTTMGSDAWPQTVEGRVLGWLLAVYAFAIFGYITATIASYFIGQDAAQAQVPAGVEGAGTELAALRAEMAALRADLERVISDQEAMPPPTRANGDDERDGWS